MNRIAPETATNRDVISALAKLDEILKHKNKIIIKIVDDAPNLSVPTGITIHAYNVCENHIYSRDFVASGQTLTEALEQIHQQIQGNEE